MHYKDINYIESKNEHTRKGQRILYQGERANIIRVKPLLVIKTRDRVICGALNNYLEHISEKSKLECLPGN